MSDTKELVERAAALVSQRETISLDEYGAGKAIRLLNERDALLADFTSAIAAYEAREKELLEALVHEAKEAGPLTIDEMQHVFARTAKERNDAN